MKSICIYQRNLNGYIVYFNFSKCDDIWELRNGEMDLLGTAKVFCIELALAGCISCVDNSTHHLLLVSCWLRSHWTFLENNTVCAYFKAMSVRILIRAAHKVLLKLGSLKIGPARAQYEPVLHFFLSSDSAHQDWVKQVEFWRWRHEWRAVGLSTYIGFFVFPICAEHMDVELKYKIWSMMAFVGAHFICQLSLSHIEKVLVQEHPFHHQSFHSFVMYSR